MGCAEAARIMVKEGIKMSQAVPTTLTQVRRPDRVLRVVIAGFYLKCTGCVNAPLPAQSHTEKRTHFFPAASNGIRNRCEPKGG